MEWWGRGEFHLTSERNEAWWLVIVLRAASCLRSSSAGVHTACLCLTWFILELH